MAKFTSTVVEKLRFDLNKMQAKSVNAEKENQATKDILLKEAQRIGDDFLQVNERACGLVMVEAKVTRDIL